MGTFGRRSFLKHAVLLTAGGVVTTSASLTACQSLAQGVPGNSQYGVKALFFDMFGTVLDWRTGVARSVEATLKPRGYSLDWLAFADAWRGEYQGAMEEVRAGRSAINAIDAGFSRALATILDSNITTFIAAAVLFYIGTGPVRGFAVTLGIGILTTLFTAFTLTRLIVAYWVRLWRPRVVPI